MATPVMKLEPVRMGSLTSSTLASGQKYVPPNKRSADGESGALSIDLGVGNFPTLGSAAKKLMGWGKHVVKVAPASVTAPTQEPNTKVTLPDPSKVSENMKDKIKQQIRQAELEDQKPKEEDPYKMTRQELLADGWAVLSLNAEAVNEARCRLNTPLSIVSLTSEDYYE